MYSKYFRLLCVGTILLLASMACAIGVVPGATATPASTTEIGKDVPPTATDTELAPTETATVEPSLTPTETLEPTLTPTPGLPIARVIKDANCRTGPSGAYSLVMTFKVGDILDIMARDLGGGFVYVRNPNEGTEPIGCWVLQTNLAISDNLTLLPAFTAPPSPTISPDFTVKYKNIDSCKTKPFVRFIIVNTGGANFRSAYIKVTNLKNGEIVEQSVNAFDLTTGCIVAQNIAPLKVGATGYLQSEFFKKDFRGQKMRAVFQLCVEQFLKGACITQSLDFIAK